MSGMVLVIEDDSQIVDLIAEVLRQHGYHVVGRLGRHALNYACGMDSQAGYLPVDTPVAIILDLMLPGLSGTAILQYLHTDPLTRAIPVIIVTAVPDRVDTLASLGAFATLHKPFLVDTLLSTIDAAVR